MVKFNVCSTSVQRGIEFADEICKDIASCTVPGRLRGRYGDGMSRLLIYIYLMEGGEVRCSLEVSSRTTYLVGPCGITVQ